MGFLSPIKFFIPSIALILIISFPKASLSFRNLGIPVKEANISIEAATQSLMRELPFTVDFYNRSHPESSLTPDAPIYISGGLALEPDMVAKVAKATGRTVTRVEPPPGCPPNFPLEQQMVNVGLMLKGKW